MDTRNLVIDPGWPAPAKINLFLHVVGRRADGYHLLQTHFQFLDYGDSLYFQPTADGRVDCDNSAAILPEHDLVVRAAKLLQRSASTTAGVKIKVSKRIPTGAGLGGGSSDAATTLVALNALWGINYSSEALSELAISLGADVPVFVRGRAAWAEGVGDILTPLDAPTGVTLVLIPSCAVATAEIFAHPELTRDTPSIKIHDRCGANLHNDCEPVTRRLHPEVGEVIDSLGRFTEARMSGTGGSVFGFFPSSKQAETAVSQMPKHWSWFIAARRNRSPLLDRVAQHQQA